MEEMAKRLEKVAIFVAQSRFFALGISCYILFHITYQIPAKHLHSTLVCIFGFEYSTYNSAPHVPKTYKNEGIS